MEQTEKNGKKSSCLLKQVLELGEQLLTIPTKLEESERVLSLMRARSGLFSDFISLKPLLVKVISEGNKAATGTVEWAETRGLISQVVQQNRHLEPRLQMYAGKLQTQLQRTETTLKANKLYVSSGYLKSVAHGLRVDKSL